jgi:hypothetical protein
MEIAIVTQPMQWALTPDIADVPPLSDEDGACLRDLRDVLAKHGRLERFGVALIHKHFQIAADECLVETIDLEHRTLTTRPVKKVALGNAIQTQWRLTDGQPVVVCDYWCNWDSGHSRKHNQKPGSGRGE